MYSPLVRVSMIRLRCFARPESKHVKLVPIEHYVHLLSPLVDSLEILLHGLAVKGGIIDRSGHPGIIHIAGDSGLC